MRGAGSMDLATVQPRPDNRWPTDAGVLLCPEALTNTRGCPVKMTVRARVTVGSFGACRSFASATKIFALNCGTLIVATKRPLKGGTAGISRSEAGVGRQPRLLEFDEAAL